VVFLAIKLTRQGLSERVHVLVLIEACVDTKIGAHRIIILCAIDDTEILWALVVLVDPIVVALIEITIYLVYLRL